ncbi:MAG: putative Se/S carrier-like protein [Clostridia bacterium]
MKKNLIVIGSITYALKAKDILFERGISSHIERNKRTKEFGCGYALYIPKNADKSYEILKEFNIKVLAFIEKDED